MQGYFSQETSLATARKLAVLVADDEPAIRDVLRVGLQREGFSVWLAADGQEALEVYRDHCETIDVVLLDVRMPFLDGPATLVAMQELTPQVPCCFMSGHLGHYTEDGLRRFGARAVLKKPFRLPEVAQALRDVVDSAARSPVVAAAAHDTLYAPLPTFGSEKRPPR
jgi:CheY-like chemotaxis protein